MDLGDSLIPSVLFGLIGTAYFLYGKRAQRWVPMLTGVALCAYPYFIAGGRAVWWIGIALSVIPYFVRGY